MGQSLGRLRKLNNECWPPKPKFSIDDIPDLTGKVIIVTGGYAGVGKETVFALLRRNAKVYIAARNREKAEAAIEELKQKTGREALFLELDLASLKSVKRAAEEYQTPLTLIETAKATPEKQARVITTSSSLHLLHGPDFKWDTLEGASPARTKYGTGLLYAQSKYGDIVVAREFSRRYSDQGIVSISLNPGNLKTDLQRHISGIRHRLFSMILHPAPMGALTQLWAGTMPETAAYNGKYLIPWARVGEPRKDAQDPETGAKLWDWLEEQVKDL